MSKLERLLKKGEFVVTAELGPPKSADREVIEEKAGILKGYADAINITDCQTAVVRLSSIASAAILAFLGLEPVAQMTCRDRNRIALQSDILGAWALGIKNILLLTGDHPKFGNHPEAKAVFDLDSIQLIQMVKQMKEEKKFLNGEEMKVEPKFFIGAVENPFAGSVALRAGRLAKKVAAGAEFLQTQIVYNLEKFSRWMELVRERGLDEKIFILAGVAPIKSAGMAKYMQNKVPGMDVPDEIVSRMEKATDAKEEGVQICVDIIKALKEIKGVRGVHIMAIEWEEAVPEIVKGAGLYPRPLVEGI